MKKLFAILTLVAFAFTPAVMAADAGGCCGKDKAAGCCPAGGKKDTCPKDDAKKGCCPAEKTPAAPKK
jgi:hypothetical protein